MKNKTLVFVIVLASTAACSSQGSDNPGGSTGGGTGGTTGGDTGGSPGGGSGGSPGAGAGGSGGAMVMVNCSDLQLTGPQTIAAGQTVTLCAGTTLAATSSTAGLTVLGTLLVNGTQASPVKLSGQGTAGSWKGIDIQQGGSVTATFLEIHDAAVGVTARSGSSFNIDHVLIDNSQQMLSLSSNGTVSHGTLHGLGDNQGASPVIIDAASPTISNTLIDQGAYGAVDMVVGVGPTSAPVFDHLEVADSHCAFHLSAGNGATISNSFIHHNAYGFMIISSQNVNVVHNNFEDDSVNIGSCSAASAVVKDNYFVGVPFGDGSCTGQLAVSGTAPATAYTDVGPSL
jgi:hypothetical protein